MRNHRDRLSPIPGSRATQGTCRTRAATGPCCGPDRTARTGFGGTLVAGPVGKRKSLRKRASLCKTSRGDEVHISTPDTYIHVKSYVASSPKRCLKIGASSFESERSWRPAGVRLRMRSMIWETTPTTTRSRVRSGYHRAYRAKCSEIGLVPYLFELAVIEAAVAVSVEHLEGDLELALRDYNTTAQAF